MTTARCAAGAFALLIALTGCAQRLPSPGSAPTATAAIIPAESSRADAAQVGRRLLLEAEPPPGARPVASSVITAPQVELGCAVVERHLFWEAPGTLDAVRTYLRRHHSPQLTVTDSGSGGDRTGETNVEVTQSVATSANDGGSSLVYSVVRAGSSKVEIRVDAEVVIAHETCAHFGAVEKPAGS